MKEESSSDCIEGDADDGGEVLNLVNGVDVAKPTSKMKMKGGLGKRSVAAF